MYKHTQTRNFHEKSCNGLKHLENVEEMKQEVEKLDKENKNLKLKIKLQGRKLINNTYNIQT